MEVQSKIRLVIKEQAKKKKVTYRVMALKAGVSEPTIKRWMTNYDIPVGAIEKILQSLGMNWFELMDLVKDTTASKTALSESQEQFLTSNPKATFIFYKLFHGFSAKQIIKDLLISKTELESYCRKLDKWDLINFIDLQHIQIVKSGPFDFHPEKPFSQKYSGKIAHNLAKELVIGNSSSGIYANQPDSKKPLNCFGEFYLTNRSYAQMQIEACALIDKFREISRRETLSLGVGPTSPVSFCFSADRYPVWQKVLWGR